MCQSHQTSTRVCESINCIQQLNRHFASMSANLWGRLEHGSRWNTPYRLIPYYILDCWAPESMGLIRSSSCCNFNSPLCGKRNFLGNLQNTFIFMEIPRRKGEGLLYLILRSGMDLTPTIKDPSYKDPKL